MKILAIICFSVVPILVFGDEASLAVRTDLGFYMPGQQVRVQLRLQGPELDPDPRNTPGFIPSKPNPPNASQNSDGYWFRSFALKFDQPGEYIVGPYSLNVAGTVVRSNAARIRVIAVDSAKPTVFFVRTNIKVGSQFYLVFLAKGNLGGIKWRKNIAIPNAQINGTACSVSNNPIDGKPAWLTTYEFSFTALKPGLFEVSPASLDGLPSDCSFDKVTAKISD